jgi:hypothetical protein
LASGPARRQWCWFAIMDLLDEARHHELRSAGKKEFEMTPVGQRFLMIYSGVITVVFAISALYGFARTPQKMTIEELDVQRINLREPDGTLRLVISDKSKAPGIFVKGKEYPHPTRKTAGMVFYNDEGTENGGLIFGGEKSKDGTKQSNGHLSFDAYEQDQTMSLESNQSGDDRQTRLQITDYPNYSIVDLLDILASIKQLPAEQQNEKINAFFAEHGRPTTRLVLGRGMAENSGDNSVMLDLNDMQGRPRIVMKVASDGTPSLQMFDSTGHVVGNLETKGHP